MPVEREDNKWGRQEGRVARALRRKNQTKYENGRHIGLITGMMYISTCSESYYSTKCFLVWVLYCTVHVQHILSESDGADNSNHDRSYV